MRIKWQNMSVDYKNSKLVIESGILKEGRVSWKSPSNIALIKYWGKHGVQLPRNASISFTLQNAFTETIMEYNSQKNKSVNIDLEFYFEGKSNPAFAEKIKKYFLSISDIFPFVKQLHFTIRSHNSFPHSSGIASSASSMSALSLCLCSLESQIFGTLKNDEEFRKKASYISRLGSGSASRSIYEKIAIWGHFGEIETTSDLYAIPYYEKIHEIFHTYHDDIFIISQGEKAVSSSAGHALMEDNLYASPRYQQAYQRMHHLLIAMEQGDIERFGTIVENEALTLHALMMTSSPSYILMKPNTLEMINRIRQFRKESQQPVYFTLDAGPNIHLLYPDHIYDKIQPFIQNQLVPLCENGYYIPDKVGLGPLELE